jgi:hypothetical protein
MLILRDRIGRGRARSPYATDEGMRRAHVAAS